jgi:hypothetical protein
MKGIKRRVLFVFVYHKKGCLMKGMKGAFLFSSWIEIVA